nr:hypothetical protein CJLB15_00026 [Campylobacter phage CJLB-15]
MKNLKCRVICCLFIIGVDLIIHDKQARSSGNFGSGINQVVQTVFYTY